MTQLLQTLKRVFRISEVELAYQEETSTSNLTLLDHIKKDAEAGKPDALYMMGKYYFDGIDVGQDYVKGFAFMQGAAAHGHKAAADEVELCTRLGKGVAPTFTIMERHTCISCLHCYNTQKWMAVESNRYLCESCQRRLVDDNLICSIEKKVRDFYISTGLGSIGKVTLKTASLSELNRRSKGKNPMGFAVVTSHQIFVFRYLTPETFSAVIAHELLHIWQYEHGMDLPQIEKEGLCELGSCLYMMSLKAEDARFYAQNKLSNSDPIYGVGLRNMYKYYEQGGWPCVLNHLTVNK